MKRPLLLLHGNAVNSKVWDLIRVRIPNTFEIHAPDLRGYGSQPKDKIIQAKRGVFDWVDDIQAYAKEHHLKHATVWGHSLGGNVLWGLLASKPAWVDELVFISPGSPYGFGGNKGTEGIMCMPDASGTGAGMVHPKFVYNLEKKFSGDGTKPYDVVSVFRNLFHEKPNTEVERVLLESAFEMQLGNKAYPGDFEKSENWPFMKPGNFGPVNALSPINQTLLLQKLKEVGDNRIKIKWIHGAKDVIVTNNSYADAGFLGKSGVIPDWPGEAVYPAQPMIDQIRTVLEWKKKQGYSVTEVELRNCGHFPFLESESFWDFVFK
ncbi:alpha/beta hydrolase [bacterium]|nr:MAG: alpha/beta hydrolase [bacterium]